jgi:hypothetical protein
MKNRARFAVVIPALLLASSASPASDEGKTRTWEGYVTDTWCGVNRDNKAPTVECTRQCVQDGTGKYAFYNFADGKVYVLNPQAEAAKYAAQRVVVRGEVDGVNVHVKTMRGDREDQTITAVSITPAPVSAEKSR